jgi:hypothetical protein
MPMRRSFSSHEQYNVADAQISETEVNGNGGAHAPILWIPVRMDFHIHPSNPRTGIRFGPLRGQIELAHRPFAVSPPANVNLFLRSDFATLNDQLYYLEFPLDAARIAFLEKTRAGGDLKLKLNLTLTVEKLFALHDGAVPHDAVWGFVNRLDVTLHDEITVPRSAWVSRVLPQIGYGTILLIELPAIPLAAVENFKAAFDSLTQAQEHHKHAQKPTSQYLANVGLFNNNGLNGFTLQFLWLIGIPAAYPAAQLIVKLLHATKEGAQGAHVAPPAAAIKLGSLVPASTCAAS